MPTQRHGLLAVHTQAVQVGGFGKHGHVSLVTLPKGFLARGGYLAQFPDRAGRGLQGIADHPQIEHAGDHALGDTILDRGHHQHCAGAFGVLRQLQRRRNRQFPAGQRPVHGLGAPGLCQDVNTQGDLIALFRVDHGHGSHQPVGAVHKAGQPPYGRIQTVGPLLRGITVLRTGVEQGRPGNGT